jgi:hypothetical protein
VDTCIFLHFKPFTQIKWLEEAHADRVILAVCLQVIDDLRQVHARLPPV